MRNMWLWLQVEFTLTLLITMVTQHYQHIITRSKSVYNALERKLSVTKSSCYFFSAPGNTQWGKKSLEISCNCGNSDWPQKWAASCGQRSCSWRWNVWWNSSRMISSHQSESLCSLQSQLWHFSPFLEGSDDMRPEQLDPLPSYLDYKSNSSIRSYQTSYFPSQCSEGPDSSSPSFEMRVGTGMDLLGGSCQNRDSDLDPENSKHLNQFCDGPLKPQTAYRYSRREERCVQSLLSLLVTLSAQL